MKLKIIFIILIYPIYIYQKSISVIINLKKKKKKHSKDPLSGNMKYNITQNSNSQVFYFWVQTSNTKYNAKRI